MSFPSINIIKTNPQSNYFLNFSNVLFDKYLDGAFCFFDIIISSINGEKLMPLAIVKIFNQEAILSPIIGKGNVRYSSSLLLSVRP